MINLNDFIVKIKNNGKTKKKFKATCDKCGKDRGYINKNDATLLCRACSRVEVHKNMDPSIKQKLSKQVSEQFQGSVPWNKGKTKIYSKKLIDQWSKKHTVISADIEYRKRMSCVKQNILIDEFKDFTTTEQERERIKIQSMGLSKQCFERDNYTCEKCNIRGSTLNAHHLNSFDKFPEQRFDLDNLVTLCKTCHIYFHNIYGQGNNTKKQYIEFKASLLQTNKKTVYLVTGASGSGKSWVCSQLTDKFDYVEHDATKRDAVRAAILSSHRSHVMYDPTVGVSTFIKRNSDVFDIKLVVIKELEEVIRARIQGRGGVFTPHILKRMSRMSSLSSNAAFAGTSDEVLNFLKNIDN